MAKKRIEPEAPPEGPPHAWRTLAVRSQWDREGTSTNYHKLILQLEIVLPSAAGGARLRQEGEAAFGEALQESLAEARTSKPFRDLLHARQRLAVVAEELIALEKAFAQAEARRESYLAGNGESEDYASLCRRAAEMKQQRDSLAEAQATLLSHSGRLESSLQLQLSALAASRAAELANRPHELREQLAATFSPATLEALATLVKALVVQSYSGRLNGQELHRMLAAELPPLPRKQAANVFESGGPWGVPALSGNDLSLLQSAPPAERPQPRPDELTVPLVPGRHPHDLPAPAGCPLPGPPGG